MAEHRLPGDIERSSMAIIRKEIKDRGAALEEQNAPVILRVIHATADFEYLETLTFSPDAVRLATGALAKGTPIVTDTNMALSGVSRPGLCKLGGEAFCFMADPAIAQKAKRGGMHPRRCLGPSLPWATRRPLYFRLRRKSRPGFALRSS